MDVSVIIVNYNTSRLIIDCLESVFALTEGISFEIIIVSNSSDEPGKKEVLHRFPGVTWIDMSYNAGFGRANNAGMKQAKGRFFLLLNADTLLTDNVIKRCMERMERDPRIAAGAAHQYYEDRTPIPFYQSFNDFRKSFFIVPPGRLFDRLLNSLFPEPSYADPEQRDWLVGAFMMVRREAFEKTGGFEACFFMYGEDVEWSWRLGKQGKLCLFNDCMFIHLENKNPYRRSRISWINRFSTQMQVANMVWLRKQYGVAYYLLVLLHYVTMIPVVYGWRLAMNVKETGRPGGKFITQHIFLKKVMVLCRYVGKTLNYKHHFFKIKPEENIDKLYPDG